MPLPRRGRVPPTLSTHRISGGGLEYILTPADFMEFKRMEETQFRNMLAARGYPEPQLAEREANVFNPEHTHDFSVEALVLDGEISVITAAQTTTCRAGETFSLAAGIEHCERYGPDGARILVCKIDA